MLEFVFYEIRNRDQEVLGYTFGHDFEQCAKNARKFYGDDILFVVVDKEDLWYYLMKLN